jgi:hypothetical protein
MAVPKQYVRRTLSESEAAQHLLNRRRARVNVVDYAGYIDVPGRPVNDDPDCELFEPVATNLDPHHVLALEFMDRVSKRDYGRGIILQPPGTAKTTYGSVVFPSYYGGRHPGHRIILVTYGDDLAKTMGHKTRSIVRQPRYKQLFDTELQNDSRAADHFLLTNDFEYLATGYKGDLPGRRAEGAILDDIVKGIKEADSEVERENVWQAYLNNVITRLLPKAWLVIIMTHWNEDDPVGRILPDTWAGDSGMFKGKDDLDWEVLCLQAQCETTTDPLKRPIGEYMALRGEVHEKHWQMHRKDARKWNALFQQRPRPIEGAFFHKEDLLDTDGLPFNLPERVDYVFAIIDSAVKTGKAHDGLAVMFFARSVANTENRPLMWLDWDLTQIQGAFLNEWIPTVFSRLESYARQCKAIFGVAGTWIEDKVSGTILLQQAERHDDWVVHPIDQGLTKLGKKERAIDVSGFVAAKEVGMTWTAYERVVEFKGSTKNHALSQVLRVSMDSKDTDADDCLDTFTYGIALSLGNNEGY